jgi:chromosomal replication initiator protein
MSYSFWTKILNGVRGRVPEGNFNAWFKPLKPIRKEGHKVWVLVPNPLFKEWIEKNYRGLFEETARELGYQDFEVVFEDGEDNDLILVAPEPAKGKGRSAAQEKRRSGGQKPSFNPQYRFDTFVVGPSNRFAYAACQAVAQNPANSYNPLYIYGGVGLGKTHLMQSIGHELGTIFPDLTISYLSTERFMNEMISSIAHRQQHEFRERYRKVDILLLDDVQFLAGKAGTQEELFHTFNALYESQKQIVISSDCPPRDLQSIEERLRSRFEWGLIADIQPPELETKIAILYKKAEAHRVNVPEEVALYIAGRIKSNIRELEGCLLRLIAFSSFKGMPITLDLAKETFENLFKEDGRAVTVESIQKHVAAFYKMKVQELKAKTNKANIVLPRQVAMYLCKELTSSSLPEIGRKFGGKHHTTVIHSIRKIEERMDKDHQLQQQVHNFIRSLR